MLQKISLNSPKNKNALSTSILQEIQEQLLAALRDPKIKAVWLESTSSEYFSAGGDVKALFYAIHQNNISEIETFFTTEYSTDYLVHIFKKPIVTWVDGIVFGGGLGLIQGASHKIFSPTAVAAMPEVLIGLFPDVGASYFLQTIPHPWREAISENAKRISASEAQYLGLCDYVITTQKQEVFEFLQNLAWTSDHQQNHDLIHSYLQTLTAIAEPPTYVRSIEETYNIEYRCPFSVEFVRQQLQRAQGKQVRECFEDEWQYAYHFCHGKNFQEGVRALLIDKDKIPKWQDEDISSYLKPVTKKSFADFKKLLDTLETYEHTI